MKNIYTLLLSVLLLLLIPLCAIAQTSNAGFVKSATGEVFIISSDKTMKAEANMKISQGDTIKTGGNSSAGLIFEDDSIISIGPNSELKIEHFLFNPAAEELSFIAKIIQGTFSFISGQIAKLAPENVKLETPSATLGVRGTKFLVKVD